MKASRSWCHHVPRLIFSAAALAMNAERDRPCARAASSRASSVPTSRECRPSSPGRHRATPAPRKKRPHPRARRGPRRLSSTRMPSAGTAIFRLPPMRPRPIVAPPQQRCGRRLQRSCQPKCNPAGRGRPRRSCRAYRRATRNISSGFPSSGFSNGARDARRQRPVARDDDTAGEHRMLEYIVFAARVAVPAVALESGHYLRSIGFRTRH